MARAADLRALVDSCPWLREDFRCGLVRLADGTAAAARLYAQDLRVIAELAGQVPRCAFDESGATPWTSFRREVALARKVSDRAAGQLVRAALRLTSVLRRAMGLLEAGVLTVGRADALVAELDGTGDELAALVDAEVADMAALLPTWRIEQRSAEPSCEWTPRPPPPAPPARTPAAASRCTLTSMTRPC